MWTFFVKFPPLRACTGKVLAKLPVHYENATLLMVPRPRSFFCDGAYNLPRHITVIYSNQFRFSINDTIKIFTGTRHLDNTDTAPAPVDDVVPPLAATFAFSTHDTCTA